MKKILKRRLARHSETWKELSGVDSGTYKVTNPEIVTGKELSVRGIDRLIMLPHKVKEFALANRIDARMFSGFALIGDEVWGMNTVMLHNHTLCTKLKEK